MPPLPDIIAGPWRAVLVLGVTEILAWGAIFYPPVLTVPLIAHERGWSVAFAMGGFSLALLTAGGGFPPGGAKIDPPGGAPAAFPRPPPFPARSPPFRLPPPPPPPPSGLRL